MARVALTAALEASPNPTSLRVTPHADRRALFVASHTEATHMSPVGFTELGMALAMEGFDVDLLPYGETVTPAHLEGVDLVVVLPVLDYPSRDGHADLYDEAWEQQEVDALEAFVAGGGFLVLTNSARRLKYGNRGLDPNEDWRDANELATRFGVRFVQESFPDGVVQWPTQHPLVAGVELLETGERTGVPFRIAEGIRNQALAQIGEEAVIALVDHGAAGGQVLILADVGFLAAGWSEPRNLAFWQSLARYAGRD
jgi:hypothetical protein